MQKLITHLLLISILCFLVKLAYSTSNNDDLKIIVDKARALCENYNYNEALQLLNNAVSSLDLTDREKSKLINEIGIINARAGKINNAITCWEKCLEIETKSGDVEAIIKYYNNIGIACEQLSRYMDAISYYKKCIEICCDEKSKLSLADTYNNLGIVSDLIGNYQLAIEYYNKSLELKELKNNRKGIASTLLNIGITYGNLSDYLRARQYFEQSLAISEEIGYKSLSGNILGNLASIYAYMDDYKNAVVCYEQSIEILKKSGRLADVSTHLTGLGSVYSDLSDYEKALKYYQESMSLKEEIEDERGIAYCLNEMGWIYQKKNDFNTAEEYYQKALKMFIEIQSISERQWSYTLLGKLYLDWNKDFLAVKNLANSIDLIESTRLQLKSEEMKIGYLSSISDVYDYMTLALLNLNRTDEAFSYMEKGRARTFLDMLANSDIKVGKNKHADFFTQLSRHDSLRTTLEEQIQASDEEVAINNFRGRLEEEFVSIQQLLSDTIKVEPEVISLVSVTALPSLENIKKMLNYNSAIIEYILFEKSLAIWLITKNSVEVKRINIPCSKIKSMVHDFHDAIVKDIEIDARSKDLSKILFTSLKITPEIKNLIIIPNHELNYLPFHLLQDSRSKFLCDNYELSYLPSAAAIKYLKNKNSIKGNSLLALGNPQVQDSNYHQLMFSKEEVDEIIKMFPESKGLVDSEASEANFKQFCGNYNIIHFACHYDLNGLHPMYSGLMLSPGKGEDGRLNIYELLTLDLNANLITLSACQSGLGTLSNGDDMVGLSRSFIYAGTPSVICSLWKVEDESTEYFMKHLYKYYKKYSKAEALRRAQLMTRKKYKSPYKWGAFILIGDPQ